MPYWSLYLEDRGFSYLQIATLMATIQLTKIIAPNVWGWLGDKTGQRVRLVRFGAITGSLFFAGVFLEPGFYGLLLVMLAFTFFWNAILPLYEVITLRSLGNQRDKYGKVRLWGSVGFIGAVALVGGILELVPIGLLPWLLLPVFAGIEDTGEFERFETYDLFTEENRVTLYNLRARRYVSPNGRIIVRVRHTTVAPGPEWKSFFNVVQARVRSLD